jgi:hypothetical protein
MEQFKTKLVVLPVVIGLLGLQLLLVMSLVLQEELTQPSMVTKSTLNLELELKLLVILPHKIKQLPVPSIAQWIVNGPPGLLFLRVPLLVEVEPNGRIDPIKSLLPTEELNVQDKSTKP